MSQDASFSGVFRRPEREAWWEATSYCFARLVRVAQRQGLETDTAKCREILSDSGGS